MRVRFRNGAPRSPPKVLLVGPPGSGRSTQAQIISQQLGLVRISPEKLVRDEMEKSHAVKVRVTEALARGEEIPEDVYMKQIIARL